MRSVAPILIALLAILAPISLMAESLPRTILFIDENTQVHPWFQELIRAFGSTIKSAGGASVYVYVENLGLDAFGGNNYNELVRTHYIEKYHDKTIGVIVCHASAAIPYALRLRDELWPQTPVIFAGFGDMAVVRRNFPSNVTGFTFRYRLQNMVDTARTLIPGLKRIVLVGDHFGSNSWRPDLAADLPDVKAGFGVIDLTGLPIAELRQRLAKLPGDSAVAYVGLSTDVTGERFIAADAAQLVSQASNRPVFVDVETFIGTGSVGGLVASPSAIGKQAAQLALRALNGEKVSDIPVGDGDIFRPIFDWRQLQRWGISEGRLPPGSEVRFRQPTAWEQYRWPIILIALVLLAQSLLIAYVLVQNRKRRRAERSLAENEERMAIAAASTNTGLWHFEDEDSPIAATAHCRTLLRLDTHSPLSYGAMREAAHPEDRHSLSKAIRDAASSGRQTDCEFRVVSPSGEIRWIAMQCHPRRDGNHGPYSVNGIVSDVSASKTAEVEAETQRREIARLMRQSILGQLSGAIAHELNQPLTAILSNAEAAHDLLGRNNVDLSKIQEIVTDIIEEDNRASEVIVRLRRLLTKGESTSEPVNLNRLVDSTLHLLRSELMKRRIEVHLELASLPMVFGDAVQLQQVLLNVIMNAMDAMSAKATSQRVLNITTRSDGRTIEVVITDSGDGVPSESQAQLFQPFFTTKSHGLGLGLTICSSIMRSHGGKLSIENNPAGGATALIALPVLELRRAV